MTPEGKVKKEIKAWLKERGAYFFMPVPTGYGKKTIDFLVCLNGRFVGIEAKAPGNEPTALQDIHIEEIRKAGGVAVWCDSLEMLKRELFKYL